MRRRGYVLAWLILALLPLPSTAQWRVVVQEAERSFLEVSEDGSLAACKGGVQGHVLQVLDPKAARILFAHAFPDPIHAVAFAKDRKTLAVSTAGVFPSRGAIFRVSLGDGRVEEILPEVSGQVAFDTAGKRLGVLGGIPDPAPKTDKTPRRYPEALALGVYDLEKQRWTQRAVTPLVEGQRVAFTGATLIGYGRGGNLHSMIPAWFYGDVQLDATTGKAQIHTSDLYSFGKQKAKRPPTKGEEGNKKDPNLGDPNYQPPKVIAAATARTQELIKQIDQPALWQRVASPDDSRRGEPHFAAVSLPDRVLFGIQRPASPGRTAAVEITRIEGMRVHPAVEATGELGRFGDRLAVVLGSYDRGSVFDAVSGKTLVNLSHVDLPKREWLGFRFSSEGLFLRDHNSIALYRPGSEKAAWSQRLYADRFYLGFLLADENRLLALPEARGNALALLYRTADGKYLGSVPRPQETSSLGHMIPLALDSTGKRMALYLPDQLLFLDVPSGRVLSKYPIKERNYSEFVGHLQTGWLISGEGKTQLFDEEKGWGPEVARFHRVISVRDVDTPAGRRLLLRNNFGRACLVDAASGKILSRWVEAQQTYRFPQERREGSEIALNGRVLLRPLAWQGAVELVDLVDLKTILTVYPVPSGKNLGWVAHTPDGLWDASPGAERYVAAVGPDGFADERTRNARRDQATIQARLRSLWKAPTK